jgi:capsular polysaccharide biosynthesis protein
VKALENVPATLDEGPGVLLSAWRYKWLVAAMVLLGMVAGYSWSVRQPTLYEATSRVLLSRRDFGTLQQNRAGQPSNDPDRFVRNQAEIITSASVLRRATELIKSDEAPVTLRGRVDVEATRGSDLLTIRAVDSTAQGAAALADAVGVAYQQVVAEQFEDAAKRAIQELQAAKSELEGRLTRLEPALQASPNDPGLESERDAIRKGLAGIDDQIQNLRVEASLAGTGEVDLERAEVPDGPTQPRPRRTAAAGALFGLFVAGALAWWLNGRRIARAGAAGEQDEGVTGRGWRRRIPGIGGGAAERGRPAEQAHLGGEGPGGEREHWLGPYRSDEPLAAAPEAAPHGNGASPGQDQEPADVRDQPLDDWPHARLTVSQAMAMAQILSGSAQPEPEGASDIPWSKMHGTEFEQLPARLQHLTDTLAHQPLTLYTDDMPQVVAEETARRLAADVVALLFDNGRGVLDVAGGVGLDEDEWSATIRHDDEAVRALLREGIGHYHRAQPGFQHTSLPGRSAEAFVMTPLLHQGLGFGVLLAGRKRVNGQPAPPFSDSETEWIVDFARDATPMLRTAVLLRYLKVRLQALD